MTEQFISGGIGLFVGAIGMMIGTWYDKSKKNMCSYHLDFIEKVTILHNNSDHMCNKINTIEQKIDKLTDDITRAREDIIVITSKNNEKN